MTTQATDEVFRSSYSLLVSHASHIVGDRGIAEEIVQDAFALLVANHGSVDNPHGWLRVTVSRRAFNELRRRSRERSATERLERPVPVPAPAVGDPELLRALDTLSGRQRTALLMVHALDMSHTDAANALGCSQATLRVHLHRGRKALRRLLDPEGHTSTSIDVRVGEEPA